MLHAVAFVIGALWPLHRWLSVWSALRSASRASARGSRTVTVTVQVPLYNEPHVAVRAVHAACALGALEVQVLDDSDDPHALAGVARAIAAERARGVDVTHVRRGTRAGFKAGALAYGLARARGDLIAILDADFVPAPDWLARAVAALPEDAALVQCRWGHLNADAGVLTRAQAALLDAHFAVEQGGRARAGRFFGFNGTAGVWRKSALVAAGGWDARTLAEDLDVSLRAHLAGSRFAYADDVVVDAELPSTWRALVRQQARWARGSVQVARARLPSVWRSRALGVAHKIDLTLKLTQNLAYVWLLALLVSLPWAGPVALAGLAFGAAPLVVSVVMGARARVGVVRAVADALLAVALAVALAAPCALAALTGALWARTGAFVRTPKLGALSRE